LHAAIGFAIGTAAVLFVPKLLALALVLTQGARDFGGADRVILSVLLEALLSAVLAPIRMLFHTQFVIAALTGWRLHWKSPPREDTETTWSEAFSRHVVHTLVGVVWAAAIYRLAPSYAWWFLPLAGSLTLSIPLSVYTSRVSLGRRLRGRKTFLIPEEADPPRELASIRGHIATAIATPRFVDAVVDPMTHAIVSGAAPSRARAAHALESRRKLVAAALAHGPEGLTDRQKRLLLADRQALAELHSRVWTARTAHRDWRASAASAGPEERTAFSAAS